MPARSIRLALIAVALIAPRLQADTPSRSAENIFREEFEGETLGWRREATDATVTIEKHERSSRAAHDGRASERFSFKSGPGSELYYSYPTPKATISDALRATLYAKSNRAGVQIFARLILPGDLDPDTGRPTAVLIPGTASDEPDAWKKLEINDFPAGLERAARVLRVGTGRKISLEGAYVEKIVVNLYGGAGETEVFLDTLTLGPIPEVAPKEVEVAEEENPPLPGAVENPAPAADRGSGRVKLVGNGILKDGADWVPCVIHAPGADLRILREYGFDTVALDADATPAEIDNAVKNGLMIIPRLPFGKSPEGRETIEAALAYPGKANVAFWDLGDSLGIARDVKARNAELERVRATIVGFRDLPEGTPQLTFGTVQDLLPQYALAGRNLDLLGIEATDWGTMREPLHTLDFLADRRTLTAVKNPRAPFLAWISACAPSWARKNVWGNDDPPSWGYPDIQPEQIRMHTYAAFSAGYRAIGFRGDSELTTERGRPRLIELALLIAEFKLVESIIARGADPIGRWATFPPNPEIPLVFSPLGATSAMNSRSNPMNKPIPEVQPNPTIKAASLPVSENRGRLLLINDYAGFGQYQPPQMALNNLKVRIQAPINSVGIEITPAGTTVLARERVSGGVEFTLPLFTGTAMVLVTTDPSMKGRLDAEIRKIAPVATEFLLRQIQSQVAETGEIQGILARDGHLARDSEDILAQAAELIKSASEARDRLDFRLAWSEAKRAGRAIRVLKYVQFNKVRDALFRLTQKMAKAEDPLGPFPLTSVVAYPPLISWNTLPQAWIWHDWIRGDKGGFGENLFESGSFDYEDDRGLGDEGWTDIGHKYDQLTSRIELVPGSGYGKPRNTGLRLVVAPKVLTNKGIDALPAFLDHEAAGVRTPPIPVLRNGLYRIRVYYRLSRGLPAATGGLILRDSIGGEPLQIRITDAMPKWREITVYRWAPADGTMTVTLGFAGYGEAYFDDLRVDALTALPTESPETLQPPPIDPIARRPSPRDRAQRDGETRPKR